MDIRTEGTVCGTINVVPAKCPGPNVLMSIRYSTYDPVTTDCDPTARAELTKKFAGWIYSGLSGCRVTGGQVVAKGYRGCPEVSFRIICDVPCKHSSCKCEDSSGSIRISPKGPGGGQVTDSESMVVNWAVKFTGKHCITTPCTAVIALAQTDRKGGSPGRPVLVPPGTFDPIETPTNPPCPKFP